MCLLIPQKVFLSLSLSVCEGLTVSVGLILMPLTRRTQKKAGCSPGPGPPPGLSLKLPDLFSILLILKENKLHKWDRWFLFVMTVAILSPAASSPASIPPWLSFPGHRDTGKKDAIIWHGYILVQCTFCASAGLSHYSPNSSHTSKTSRERVHFCLMLFLISSVMETISSICCVHVLPFCIFKICYWNHCRASEQSWTADLHTLDRYFAMYRTWQTLQLKRSTFPTLIIIHVNII